MNEHGVAEAEEPVFFLYRHLVGVEDVFPGAESGNQHDQCALGQMEVGHQGIHEAELVAGIDEDAGPIAPGLHFPAGPGAFQGPYGGGAHGDDTPAFPFGFVDGVRRFLGNGVFFLLIKRSLLLRRSW